MDQEEINKILGLHKIWLESNGGQRANLSRASLYGATYGENILIGENPRFILGLRWEIYVFKDHIKIGCEIHSKKSWRKFSNSEILSMDRNALEFWKQYKSLILHKSLIQPTKKM